MCAGNCLEQLYGLVKEKFSIHPADIESAALALRQNASCNLREIFLDTLFTTYKKKNVTPRNPTQKKYVDAARTHDIVFAVGPAGTGKTYNITKIYLRLLLEKEDISVQNILIMTFTKSATEELRGRIDKEIRQALEQINQSKQIDDFYQQLFQDKDKENVCSKLKAALLELDEAAIFTIHGFCARVLKNQAYTLKI